MQRTDFELKLKQQVLVISGTISSEIERRLKIGFPFAPRYILENSELIEEIQTEFARKGANILVTGTSKANSEVLRSKTLQSYVEVINQRAVEICKKVARPETLVFGSLGSTGALLKPYGRVSEQDYRDIFNQQAGSLLAAGVDGLILEGFSSLIEAEQCVLGLREICAVPIIATMTFLEDGSTKFGDSMDTCFSTLMESGANVVGIHGTLGPVEIENFLARLQGQYPLCVRPNAGYPVRIGNTQTYLSSPDYVAEFAESFRERGAVIVGGAAGFTPAHIKAVAERMRGQFPVAFKKEIVKDSFEEINTPSAGGETEKKSEPTLRDKLGKSPVISVELEPPHGLAVEHIINLLHQLQPYGVDAVNIPENPLARARISAIALAKLIRERTGLESIAHVTCRDRNLISLQAELLGAHMLGVNNILALTGDPAGVGDYPSATSNFDVDSLGLVEILNRMNIGKDFGMNDLGASTRFNIGVAANPLSNNMPAELERLEAKIRRGAAFIQTQPIFDPNCVEPFLRAIEPFGVPVLFGVMLIRDYRNARFLINEYPGIHIREEHMERFRTTSEEKQEALGVEIACELVKELSPMSGGVYLMSSFGEEARLLDVFKRLKG